MSGVIKANNMRNGMIITAVLTFISGIVLLYMSFGASLLSTGALVLFALGLVSIMAAIKYTAGKNPYGYKGFGDLSVFLFFGLIGVLGTTYLYTHELKLSYILPATSIGALSVAVLNLNNMRDREEDEKAGKMTIPVHIGPRRSKLYHLTLLVIAANSALLFSMFTNRPFHQFIYIIPFVILAIHAFKVIKTSQPEDFDPELKKVALSTFLFSILFGLGLTI